jgi:hypothetical protein
MEPVDVSDDPVPSTVTVPVLPVWAAIVMSPPLVTVLLFRMVRVPVPALPTLSAPLSAQVEPPVTVTVPVELATLPRIAPLLDVVRVLAF